MNFNSSSSEDSSEFESKMARLVGLEEEKSVDSGVIAENSVLLELESPELEKVVTDESFSSNPLAKLALVGGINLFIVVLVGAFLSHLISYKNQKPKSNIVNFTVESQPTQSRQQILENEIEILKTKLALTEQAQTVTKAQQNLRIPATLISKVKVQSSKHLTASKARISTPVRTVIIASRIQNPNSQKVTHSQNIATFTPAPPPSIINTNAKPSPPDPLQEWANLAKLGSYGEVYVTAQFGVNPISSQPENTNVASQSINSNSNPNPTQELQKLKVVKVGSTAKAVITTIIFGETNQKQENKNIFIVRLKEPLKATDGTIALPKDIELLTKIDSISERGLLQLNVIKFISDNNGKLIETSLPNNAIIIHSIEGKPLIASKYSNSGSSIASMDAGLFVIAGVQKAAELLNRGNTTYQYRDINNNNNPQIFTNDNQRNIAAGIVEGGLNYVVPQIAQRNQQAITQMLQKTNVWFLPAGKEVEIYVNHTVQF
ncbi:TrbI/VirB10 family protein [Nostoc sp. DSM 114161]|jgi:hypothetical protein|uniref:TrbI/VirB10 family protein n=1 Tax=Nostoc sp. DSM 114161 TaxID=3440143 RepID=UPI0040460CDB